MIPILKKFIESNTPIGSLHVKGLSHDFGEEMKWNHNIVRMNNDFPWSRFCIERNIRFYEIVKKFKVKPISQVKTFNILFHFQ
jgi:hypothetical protein